MFRCAGQEQRKWLWNGKSMNWVSVDSSVFASVAYRGDERQLFLRFHSGKVYRYFGFPPDQMMSCLQRSLKAGILPRASGGSFSMKRFARPMAARVDLFLSRNRSGQNAANGGATDL